MVLTDLRDAACPCIPEALSLYGTVGEPAPAFVFCFTVRELESWLLADKKGLAGFLRVSRKIFPAAPELVEYPKQVLLSFACRSRSSRIRNGVAREGKERPGPEYTSLLGEFVTKDWDIEAARQTAPRVWSVVCSVLSN